MTTTTFNHPILGDIEGIVSNGTVQFRGIKYASLKSRFAEPELQTQYSNPVNATQYG